MNKLSPERTDANKRMKLHLSNIEASYPDMADGHACALMGFTWGLAGVYASDDSKLKKKVTSHYKAWFNLARCDGSDSYVILPGRDYADESYYRDNIRNHTTAAIGSGIHQDAPGRDPRMKGPLDGPGGIRFLHGGCSWQVR